MQEQSSGSKVLFALLALILLTGAAWRIWLAVTSLPMSSEEFGTWRDVTRSNLGQMITWDHHRTHPPLNYLLVKLSILLTGREDMWVLRLPTLLFSILSIPLGYLLGRSLHGKTMGVSLAGIMAFWSFLLHQAHYARMYSATVAFGLLALWMLARSCAPLPSRASGLRWMPSVALGASLAALFWTSSAGLFLVAGIPLGLVGGWVLVRLAKLPSNEQPARANQFAGLAVTVGTWFLMSLPGLLHYLHESRQRAGRVVFIGGEPVEGGRIVTSAACSPTRSKARSALSASDSSPPDGSHTRAGCARPSRSPRSISSPSPPSVTRATDTSSASSFADWSGWHGSPHGWRTPSNGQTDASRISTV